jgi:hypothetical protein
LGLLNESDGRTAFRRDYIYILIIMAVHQCDMFIGCC